MAGCQHEWEMTNVRFGFVIFEKCFHCNTLRTYFSESDHPIVGDEYLEGEHTWRCMENAQSLQFDLQCKKCNHRENFDEIMGFMYCTDCLSGCQVEILQKKYLKEKTWVVVAFGFFPVEESKPLTRRKLKILEDYFNQRRDTSRSRIAVLSYDLIKDFSRCEGVFIHDVGMLSTEPPKERKKLF